VPDRLTPHDVRLGDGALVLRPMTEDDWPTLERWMRDPEVLWWSEGADVTSYSPEEVRGIYRQMSSLGYAFVAELDGHPIGEVCLQRVNLDRVRARYARDADLRRMPITIGEKELWGRGLGTRIIRLLTRHAFEMEGADAVIACGVSDTNVRSRRAFEKNGYVVDAVVPLVGDPKASEEIDLVLTRERWAALGEAAAEGADRL
jgi:RimJ/RimL family protein N-acetyltransferase